MGKHKDQATPENPWDVAFTAGYQAALKEIRDLAEDSDWIRVSDIEELLT